MDVNKLKFLGVEGLFISNKNKKFFSINDCQESSIEKLSFIQGPKNSEIFFIAQSSNNDECLLDIPYQEQNETRKLYLKILKAMNLSFDKVSTVDFVELAKMSDTQKSSQNLSTSVLNINEYIQTTRPKVVVCLGLTSAINILETDKKLKDLRCKFYDKFNTRFLITYHPAALLKDNRKKKLVWDDLQMVMKEIDNFE